MTILSLISLFHIYNLMLKKECIVMFGGMLGLSDCVRLTLIVLMYSLVLHVSHQHATRPLTTELKVWLAGL
jgi:hypothetical protein